MLIAKNIKILRMKETEKQTMGIGYIHDEKNPFSFHVLELPWRDNKQDVSRIPEGTYKAFKWYSKTFKTMVIRYESVPGRTDILIHPANKYTDIKGCQIPGDSWGDLNADGIADVLNSGKTLKKMLKLLPDKFEIEIIDVK